MQKTDITHRRTLILCLLGALSVITPFSIDMYLSAFPAMAKDLHTTTPMIARTLSSYFIGLAVGQLLYGPLLDRFGRKPPLYAGLALYVLASFGCCLMPDVQVVMFMRFLQAVGGCAAGVASLAMVKDFFADHEAAKILSIMFLFIGISPLCAPTVGSLVVAEFGWKAVFILLGSIASAIMLLMYVALPEPHKADPGISLKPGPILAEYWNILQNRRFAVYALSGAFSFAGLFTFVAGAPIVFMDNYHLTSDEFARVFALLAMGFLGSGQINVQLLKRFDSSRIFTYALLVQTVTGVLFLICTALGLLGLYGTVGFFFLFLCCAGLTYPNAAANAMEPFTRNAGSASSLLGFLQMSVGAAISMLMGGGILTIIATLAFTVVIGKSILIAGRRHLTA